MPRYKPQPKPVVVRPSDTPEHRAKLDAIVSEIKAEMDAAFKVMEKLAKLKASRLYCITGKTWDEFVDDEFPFTKQWADELIAAYDGRIYLDSEHARALFGNSEFPKVNYINTTKTLAAVGRIAQKGKDVKAVISKAAEKGKVTHKTIKEAAAEIEKAKKQQKAEKAEASPIPKKIAQAIEAGKMVRGFIKQIRAACKRLDDFAKSPYAVHLSAGQHTDAIRRALEHFKYAAPYADCVRCGGHGTCKHCDSTGWLRKCDFDTLPAALKSTSRIFDVESDDESDDGVEI